MASLAQEGAPLARWKAAADLWCAAWFHDGAAGLRGATFAAVLDEVLGRGACFAGARLRAAGGRRAACGGARAFLSLDPRVPGGLSRRGRPPSSRLRLRCRAGQPAVGDAPRRCGSRRSGGSPADGLHASVRRLQPPERRARQSVSVVSRACPLARPHRRPCGHRPAVRLRVRSRVRGAAAARAGSHAGRHVHLDREPRRPVPDPSRAEVSADRRHAGSGHNHAPLPFRRALAGRARRAAGLGRRSVLGADPAIPRRSTDRRTARHPGAPHGRRRRDCVEDRVLDSGARRSSRMACGVRTGAQRDGRQEALRRGQPSRGRGPSGDRRKAHSAVRRRRRRVARAHPGAHRRDAPRSRSHLFAAAARLPGRGRRHKPPDVDRGDRSGRRRDDAHAVLPEEGSRRALAAPGRGDRR